MGYFTYDSQTKTEFEDRLMAHMQIVIGSKLRRSESFYLSWKDPISTGSGRTSVWLHPAASLKFKFAGNRAPSINRVWLEALMTTANAPGGLYAVREPEGSAAQSRMTDETVGAF